MAAYCQPRAPVVGYQAFLIGESLMKADDPGLMLTQLIGEAKAPSLQ